MAATATATRLTWLWIHMPAAGLCFGVGFNADGIAVEAAEVAADLLGATETEVRAAITAEDPTAVIKPVA